MPDEINNEVNDTEVEESTEGEEMETPSESSSEEKPKEPEETEETTPEKEEITSEEEGEQERLSGRKQEEISLKTLPEETPRERALRLEVTRLKRQRQKERAAEIFTDTQVNPPTTEGLSEEDMKILSTYDQNELNNFEKILDVLGKKKGWVRKGEVSANAFQERGQEYLDQFLEEHPEYSSDNDPDNILWARFKEEFALYKQPSNPKDLKKIFNKIHRDMFEVLPEDDLKKVTAQKEKLKVASHSGATSNKTASSPQQSGLDPSLKKHLKGFGDDELEDIFGA